MFPSCRRSRSRRRPSSNLLPASQVSLPTLGWRESPNQSVRRLGHREAPYLVVVHRPVGSYAGSVGWLCNPASQASAHVVTEHDRATQLVPWDRKAWHARSFNSVSYGVEVDDNAWDGADELAFRKAARLVAYLCSKTEIPPAWSCDPLRQPGVVRHYDLGAAGGGHTDPTISSALWRTFLAYVHDEHARGGFRDHYGRGTLDRI